MTSPPEQITVECPKCGHVYEDWYRPSINADLDPQMIANAEYMRQASTATCPKCSHVVDIGVLVVKDNVWTFDWQAERFAGRADDVTATPPKTEGDR